MFLERQDRFYDRFTEASSMLILEKELCRMLLGLIFRDIIPAHHRELDSDQRGKLVITPGWKESSLPPKVAHEHELCLHSTNAY